MKPMIGEMEMDELKLKLSTKFMRGIVTKLISMALYKKFGYQIDIEINEINMETKDGKIRIHADVDAEMDNEECLKLIKTIGIG